MSKHTSLIAVLAAYLVFGALFAVRVPEWQSPDEPAHYNYVASLARGVWPMIEKSDWDPSTVPIAPDAQSVPVDRITYQDHQPPLFYALGAPVFAASGGSLTALRLWTLLIGAVGVAACYATVMSIFPGRTALAGAAAAVYALLPQHLHVLSSYNNDALSEALLAATILQSVRLMRDVPTNARVLLLAATVGAAMWTKAQAYLALPIGALALFMAAPQTASAVRVRRAAAFVGAAMLIASPLWIRNIAVYGGVDFLGLQAHNHAVAGQLTAAALIDQVGISAYLRQALQTTFQSFWAMFGWMSVLPGARIYQALLGVTAASAAAFMWWWLRERRALDPTQRRGMLLLAALYGASIVAYVWYNAQFVQFQGRYLYPGLIPIALGAALGWEKAASRWAGRVWLAALAVFIALDAYMLLRVIGPGFAGG